ncbi:SurA N-terminal domain-containing protein [Caulobacter sp. S45]|uniref:peptidylprolyl isomerase n=1 Tax=Caulobacter sp. S45 TaxID=1641861 RepID=UPI001577426B|nr:SurA N-terminal domain-containing protein [Caulobacter sp. S45]
MLTQFRSFAKTTVAKLLLGVLAASFLIWGIRDVFRNGMASDAVITAGARTVTSARFRQMFQDELKQYGQQSGQTVTVQDAISHNIDHQVADAIAADEALAAYIDRIGIRPGDKQIVAEIAKAPRFFNAVSGRFDRQAYEAFVQQIGMTDTEFEGVLRDELAQTQFVSGVAAGLSAPLLFSALQAAYTGEGRSFDDFVLPPTAVPLPAQPTDAAMNGFIKQNAAQLMRPESRVFTVAAFSTQALAAQTTADPALVQKRFDFEKDSLSVPEKRSLVEVPVRDAGQGRAVAARLSKGEDPQAVAASLHVQPIVYTDSPKTAVADRKLADVAFGMSVGQVQGPVQGDLGLAVVKLSKVTPGHVATLDEARTHIEQEVKGATALNLITKQVQSYENARSGGSNLADAAKAAGAQTTTLPPITAQGTTLQRQKVGIPPKLLQAGFALQPGQDSDIVDLGQGEYAALRLDKVIAPAPPALDEVRPLLTRFMMQQDLFKRLQAKADGIAAAVSKGETLQAAAAANKATVAHGEDVLRTAAGKTYSNELMGHLFLAKPGDVVTGPDLKIGVVIAKLQAVVPATAQTAAQAAADQRQATNQSMVQDFAAAVRNGARDIIKPRVDYAKARQALGVDQGAGAGQ